MFAQRPFHAAFRAVATLVATTTLIGCSSYRMVKAPPEEAIPQAGSPPRVRVTTIHGTELEMRKAHVVGDSLIGTGRHVASRADSWEPGSDAGNEKRVLRLAVALRDISILEVRRFDAVKTVLVVTGVGLVAALVVMAVAAVSLANGVSSSRGSSDFLASACAGPWIECWDGATWRLDSGTFAGAFSAPLARTDVSLLAQAEPVAGTVHLRLSSPPGEQEFVDAAALLAVDHRPGATPVPDAEGRVHLVAAASAPLAAHDLRGVDALARVGAADGIPWESSLGARDPAVDADLRDGLELEFARPPHARRALLMVDGNNSGWTALLMGALVDACHAGAAEWQHESSAGPQGVEQLAAIIDADAALRASVWNGSAWMDAGRFAYTGSRMPKRQGLALDLSGIPGDRVRVRLQCAPSFWLIDRVALAAEPEPPAAVHELAPARALGPLGLDVRKPLAAADGTLLTMAAGDTVHLEFAVPPVPVGRARTYLARTTGWYRIEPTPGARPDSISLRRLMTEPHAVARLSVERVNRLLAN